MKIKLKLIAATLLVGTCLTNVSYGAEVGEASGAEVERSEMSIADASIRPEVRIVTRDANELLRVRSFSGTKEARASKLQKMNKVLPILQQLLLDSQNRFEREWLGLQIRALLEMISVYENTSASYEEREQGINKVLAPAMQEQWDFVRQCILSSQLRGCLQELHSINQEKRILENQPQKTEERQFLEKRMLTAGERFFAWYDNVSTHNELEQAELKALDEAGILPPQTIESLRRIVSYLKEKQQEVVETSSQDQ